MTALHNFTDERQIYIEIRTLEWLSQNRPEQLTLPKKPGYMEIVWIKKAFGTCQIDLEKQTIGEDEIYCIGTRQLRHFQADGCMEGYYLSFAPAFINPSFERSCSYFETRLQGLRGKIKIVLDEDQFKDDIELIIGKMIREFSLSCDTGQELLQVLLLLLMTYLSRHVKQEESEPASGRKHELINRFLVLIEKYMTTNKMVHDFATELGISPNYLNFIVKQLTGFSATHHIQQSKLIEAKKQIVWHGKSLKEVAYHLGFQDPAHFSHFFKAKTGGSFQSFRNGIKLNRPPGF